MNKLKSTLLSLVAAAAVAGCSDPGSDREMDRFIDGLMKKMTVEEKIGQMNLIAIDGSVMTGPVTESATGEKIVSGEVGALLNVMVPEKIRDLQELVVTKSRLGIPLLFGMDVIHGYNTVFPMPIGLSATWNMASVEEVARISAVEATAQGVNWTFSPMVDLSYDARWGRVAEGAGEDPYLASEIARAYVRGYQGDLSRNDNLLACVKHFALYGAPEAGRDYNLVDMGRMRMYNEYFLPYKAAVEEGAATVMSAFNEVEGVPAAANKWLLDDVLRKQWGFDGFVVSDWDAVREITVHGIGDLKEVSVRALDAGLDMDMASQGFAKTALESLGEGRITEKQIDRACRRVLEAKYKLGLFADPYKYNDLKRLETDILTPEHRAAARRIAAESFVLLKNRENTLPLARKGVVAVVGPFADNRPNQLGSWAFGGDIEAPTTVLEGLREATKGRAEVVYAMGCNITDDPEYERVLASWGRALARDKRSDAELMREALAAARRADVVVAVMGEAAEMSGEGASRTELGMPAVQQRLLGELKKLGKPIVLVLFSGRPMTLVEENNKYDAILYAWFPGTEGGPAVADVLFGDAEPGGRLTMSFPRSVGQVPIHYNGRQTGRPAPADGSITRYVSGYVDESHLPLYPFGYGLTYTTFEYGDVILGSAEMSPGGTVEASVEVTNTGSRSGTEVVQLYLRDPVASVTRPLKELKGFEKIRLEPGETKTVTFTIDSGMLEYYDNSLERVLEPGAFDVMIGPNSAETKSATFTLLKQ